MFMANIIYIRLMSIHTRKRRMRWLSAHYLTYL